MWLKDYGLSVYRNGIVLHSDGRWRRPGIEGTYIVPSWYRKTPYQGKVLDGRYVVPRGGRDNAYRSQISGLSRASARRLEFIAANADVVFRMHVTLTYRARAGTSEKDAARNLRIVRRSKKDLNRFLDCVRDEVGPYLWVQEFQRRGVLHYHLLAERLVEEDRIRVAWLRSIGALDDPAAVKHGVKVEAISKDEDVRKYLSRYLGKARQKNLPPGVERAGRWWGRSRTLKLALLRAIVACKQGAPVWRKQAARAVRCLRKFVGRKLGFRYRGGMILDWSGELSAAAGRAAEAVERFYGEVRLESEPSGELTPEKIAMLLDHGWVPKYGGFEHEQGADDGSATQAGSEPAARPAQCELAVA